MTYPRQFIEAPTVDVPEEERLAIWTRPGLTDQQRIELWSQQKAQSAFRPPVDDASTPPLRRELDGTSRRSSAPRSSMQTGLGLDMDALEGQRTPLDASTLSAAPMARAWTTAAPSYRPTNTDTITGKRTRQQSESGYSTSYPYGTATWQLTGAAPPPQHRLDNVLLDPLEYIEQSLVDFSSEAAAVKRPRIDRLGPSTTSFTSYTYGVSPVTSMSNSLSPPTPISLSSETMSRQSSATSTSVADAMSMMRVGSSFSTSSETPLPFPFDAESQLCDSFSSSTAATEVPSNSDPITTCNYDPFEVTSKSVQPHPFFFNDAFSTHQETAAHPGTTWQAAAMCRSGVDMQRTMSEQSNASSLSIPPADAAKACARLRKQIRNGQRQILSKTLPSGPTSISHSKRDPKVRPLRPQDLASRRKQPIAKQPAYVRPQHPKLYCEECDDYPNGFRGEHELNRHHDRMHRKHGKIWICVDPPALPPDGPRPLVPLNICKHCVQRKPYNVYYNAAAHLRRSHFAPRKRGRRARGEKAEKRAGKAGGNWPPIEWLKKAGFMKEMDRPDAADGGSEDDEVGEDEDVDLPGTPSPVELDVREDDFVAVGGNETGLPPGYSGFLMPSHEDGMMQQHWPTMPTAAATTGNFAPAPLVQHEVGAPGLMMMPPMDGYGNFYPSSGDFGFLGEHVFEP